MKNKLLMALAIFLTYYFSSCDDIIEKDLTDDWVYGISPQDFAVANDLTQTFKWEKVKGAESYNLQIYKTAKDYNTIQEFVADTNVKTTQYVHTLKPGYYKWFIYAQNGSSRSGMSIFRFQVDSTSDVSNQKVVLIYPTDKKLSDSLLQTFSWVPLPAAKQYNLQIFESGNNIALFSKITTGSSESYTFQKKGTYKWRVSAMNGTLTSPYTEYTLTIDTSIATVGTPVVVSPKNDTTTIRTNPVVLTWNGVSGASSYRIEVARDTTGTARDTTATAPATAVSQTYFSTIISTKYYWRIKAIKNGTEGTFSRWWLFRRNP